MDKEKLYQRYAFDVEWRGDTQIKKDLKQVRRVATELGSFLKAWDLVADGVLSPQEAKALESAGVALGRLTAALATLPRRARADQARLSKDRLAKENARLDKLAEGQDWALDEASVRREAALLHEFFVKTNPARDWVAAQPGMAGVAYCISRLNELPWERRDQLGGLRPADPITLRRVVAETLDLASRNYGRGLDEEHPDTYYLRLSDYTDWKRHKG